MNFPKDLGKSSRFLRLFNSFLQGILLDLQKLRNPGKKDS